MPDTVVYVSNASKESISSHERGELTLLDKVLVPGTDKPSPTSMPMAVTPDHRFLCAALRSDPFPVSSFAIDPASGVDGKITGKTVFCSKRHHGACATVFRTAISIPSLCHPGDRAAKFPKPVENGMNRSNRDFKSAEQ